MSMAIMNNENENNIISIIIIIMKISSMKIIMYVI